MRGTTVAGIDGYEDGWFGQERQRLATYGASVLSERELLALLVGAGAPPGCDLHALAGRLLARFRSVRAIGRAHPAELAAVRGLGATGAARLVAAFELARRAGAEDPPATIGTAEDLVRAVRPLLAGQTRERLVVVVCDRASRVIGHEVLSVGAADRALLPVREAMVAVLCRDGQKFALAHNHPSGDPTPSSDDINATRRVRDAARTTGLRLLGHVVVTDNAWQVVNTPPAVDRLR